MTRDSAAEHPDEGTGAVCRFCDTPLEHTVVDLGMSPLCQSLVEPERLDEPETFHPLHVRVCHSCWLVQTEHYVDPGMIFSDYAYFSSYSDSWIEHVRGYAEDMVQRLSLGADDLVVELASNDGYLLQHFRDRGVPVHGIDPAANVARTAIDRGIPTTVEFFGEAVARRFAARHGRPRLLIGNNVLAHVPDLHDFVAGMRRLLARGGTITMEFPHLLRLIEGNQFDTIYHEHYSYLSFGTAERIFAAHGLVLFDVEELPTHGGSLRIHATHAEDEPGASMRVERMRAAESAFGLDSMAVYEAFGARVERTKRRLLSFLIGAKEEGRRVVGYGAPGKGNTLLNYCGIRKDFLDFTVDRSPHKQGRYTPGTRIPILGPATLREARPDYVLILPWNLRAEVVRQTAFIRDWGGAWVVPIPEVRVLKGLSDCAF